ncbi:MAG: S8/S53 family peptidase [Xanthomonadales bacterium]|nr:S8/S53 family peptidase [Xanthomonadales bacterium]
MVQTDDGIHRSPSWLDTLSVMAIDLGDEQSLTLSQLDQSLLLQPSQLQGNPRDALEQLKNGALYWDPIMGVLVGRNHVLHQLGSAKEINLVDFGAPENPKLELVSGTSDSASAHANDLWYLSQFLGDWPQETGRGVKIAVIDSGVAGLPGCLDGAIVDFLSLENPESNAWDNDSSFHGTQCCGVIGSRNFGEPRTSVAPDCGILIGQVSSTKDKGYIAAVEFILLTSWAVAKGARIISFSYVVTETTVSKHANPELFSVVAKNLRQNNAALIFCAAGNADGPLYLPAAADGMIAVSGYLPGKNDMGPVRAHIGLAGFTDVPAKSEFFLGPSQAVASLLPAAGSASHEPAHFALSSAACAFVAGIAALYLEAFETDNLEQILLRMRKCAKPVFDAKSGRSWAGACFPPPKDSNSHHSRGLP